MSIQQKIAQPLPSLSQHSSFSSSYQKIKLDPPPNSLLSQPASSQSVLPQQSELGSNEKQQTLFLNQSLDFQKVLENPFGFINQNTTRQTLFKIIYMLEEQNGRVVSCFQKEKKIVLGEAQAEKLKIVGVDEQERKIVIGKIKERNMQYKAQKALYEMYKNQHQQLQRQISQKQHQINRLHEQVQHKQFLFSSLDQQTKQNSDRLLLLKQQKAKLLDDMKKKKNTQKMADSGTIDRLLREYYETIKQAMTDDSVERINKNTKAALSQVGQAKVAHGGMFAMFMEGLENRKSGGG